MFNDNDLWKIALIIKMMEVSGWHHFIQQRPCVSKLTRVIQDSLFSRNIFVNCFIDFSFPERKFIPPSCLQLLRKSFQTNCFSAQTTFLPLSSRQNLFSSTFRAGHEFTWQHNQLGTKSSRINPFFLQRARETIKINSTSFI